MTERHTPTVSVKDSKEGGEANSSTIFPISWSDSFSDLHFYTKKRDTKQADKTNDDDNAHDHDHDNNDDISYDTATEGENKSRNTRFLATDESDVETGTSMQISNPSNFHHPPFDRSTANHEGGDDEEMQPMLTHLEKKFEEKFSRMNDEIYELKEKLKHVEEDSKKSIDAINTDFQDMVELQGNRQNKNQDENSAFHTRLGYTGLTEDTYALMMIQNEFNKTWLFSFMIFAVQMILLILIFSTQVSFSVGTTVFDVPFNVSPSVRIAQFLAIIIAVLFSTDVVMPIKDLSILWFPNQASWSRVVMVAHHIDARAMKHLWFWHIFFPNALKFSEGILVLIITYVIVIQSDNIIDLFKDFAAMQIIAELDNASFYLAKHGYVGSELKQNAEVAQNVRINDHVPKLCLGLALRPFVLILLLTSMIGSFIPIIVGQATNSFFHDKYPNCRVKDEDVHLLGNGMCNGGLTNSFQCGFDHGDCIDFNLAFPNCNALQAYQVGDGKCQDALNTEACGYDGGDCCPIKYNNIFLKEKCHAGFYNTKACRYNDGQCDDFQFNNQFCPDVFRNITKADGSPVEIGDGICDFIPEYMNDECNYEGGDCEDCRVKNATQIGDGICNPTLNTEGCHFDNGDCETFNREYPDCNVPEPSFINNGVCNGGEYNTKECRDDGGDCSNFNKDYPNCNADDPSRIGNGICETDYNTKECKWDGGDCNSASMKYPDCPLDKAFLSFLGDGKCDGKYSGKDCGYDGGDCASPNNDRFCGSNPIDAMKCGNYACPSGLDWECPGSQKCFGNITCSIDFRCGTDLEDAKENCNGKKCGMGNDDDCGKNQFCYGLTSCSTKDQTKNYCGTSYGDANNKCATRCPSGKDGECPSGQKCYSGTSCSAAPPVQSSPSVSSSIPPSVSPSVSPSVPAKKICGTTWADANNKCAIGTTCPSGSDGECPSGQKCYGGISCAAPPVQSSPSVSSSIPPSVSVSPSASPSVAAKNICGTNWADANNKCAIGTVCPRGVDSECSSGQKCFKIECTS